MSDGSRATGGVGSANRTLAAFGITQQQLLPIGRLGSVADVDPERLVTAFYDWLETQPFKQEFFPIGVPAPVRTAQVGYWRTFLSGNVDDAYIVSRHSVGKTHARIGLPPKAYTTAMAFAQRWFVEAIVLSSLTPDERMEAVVAVSALCQLDSALVMDAYSDYSNQLVKAEADKQIAVTREVARVVAAASEGDFSERYVIRSGDDERLGKAVNQMLESVESTIRQVQAVAAGDYSTNVTPRSASDQLGRVLAEMTARLREATERTQRDQWLKQGHADVFERMRGELEVTELSRSVLTYICGRIDAPAGCIYVPDEDETDTLRLVVTFGVPLDSRLAKLRYGQGIVGEAARSREPVFDLDVSSSPVRVSYGLGEIVLDRATILPLTANGLLCGMMQITSAGPLSAAERELLNLVAENIAIGISGASARTRMRLLLERSQNQSEELQTQAEELRASNEELEERGRALQVAREQLESRNAELQRKQAAVEEARSALEERAKELVQASKYKSEFLANMSHELRTPLNSMLILTESLCSNPDRNLSKKQLESLEIVRGGGIDLLRIINDILDLSKVEAGQLSIEVGAVSLSTMVNSLKLQFAALADSSQLELTVEIEPRAPASIRSDEQRIRQILKNLLANALKFTHEGSVRLLVFSPPAGTRFHRNDLDGVRVVGFSVTDTGIGIAADKLAAIFEAFQQADGSTSRKYGGTGLGLTVSRQLAKLLGGEIQLESTVGKGSRFTLYLPLSIEAAEPERKREEDRVEVARPRTPEPAVVKGGSSSAARRPSPVASPTETARNAPTPAVSHITFKEDGDAFDGSAPTMLVVEDDPEFCDILANIVRQKGYKVVTAGCGRDALVLAQTTSPDGIVLDLGLPDIDGMEVLQQLKSNLATRHVPVHVVSGHDCRPQALQLGAMGFLEKPVDGAGLSTMFERFEQLWNRQSGRVLVVEDDSLSQSAIRELLNGKDVVIDIAGTGAEGLEKLEQGDYDCLVVDLGLPDMDGGTFLKQLGDNHPPVIVYTARDLDDAELRELSSYTDSVVIKGVRSPERLLDEVSLFLHQIEKNLSDSQRTTLTKLHEYHDALHGRHVLIVDDDMRNVFAMTELLQRQGMEVTKAKNGKVALERLDSDDRIEIVIMDIMMPVMDGLEAMRRIRAQPRFARLPIIALTAKTLHEDRQACLEAGASDYITKPMDPANLLALMRVMLFDSKHVRAPSIADRVGASLAP